MLQDTRQHTGAQETTFALLDLVIYYESKEKKLICSQSMYLIQLSINSCIMKYPKRTASFFCVLLVFKYNLVTKRTSLLFRNAILYTVLLYKRGSWAFGPNSTSVRLCDQNIPLRYHQFFQFDFLGVIKSKHCPIHFKPDLVGSFKHLSIKT